MNWEKEYDKLRADCDKIADERLELAQKVEELKRQYQELAESSSAAIKSLTDQRSELKTQVKAYRLYLYRIGVDPDKIKVADE